MKKVGETVYTLDTRKFERGLRRARAALEAFGARVRAELAKGQT